MCLITRDREPKVASCDIECFKLVIRRLGKFFTPYRYVEVKMPCTMTAADIDFLPKDDSSFKVGCVPRYEVTSEGVHAYTDLKTAKIKAQYLDYYHVSYIVRCIVPKGIEYWLGVDNDIAARKMRIEKIIN